MSEVEHTVAALLRDGASPTATEVEDLSAIGRFVSAMVARLTSGVSTTAASAFTVGRGLKGMDQFEDTSPILSAATADRWLEAMGSGSRMLEPRLSRPTAVDVDPFAWSRLVQDAVSDLPVVRLIEGQARARLTSSSAAGARTTPRSLFGPETPRDALSFAPYTQNRQDPQAQPTPGQSPTPEVASTLVTAPVTLADGSKMAPEVVSALVAAGLSLAATPPASPSMLRLDGLGVNDRTPALASALRHISGPARSAASSARPTSGYSVGSPERMGARVLAALEPRDLAAAPQVQLAGAYDSVAGDFLHVVPPSASRGPNREPMRSHATSPVAQEVSLETLVPPKQGTLRPFTDGVFPPASGRPITALVAAQHAPSGAAIPLTERGPIGPPLVRAQAARAAMGEAREDEVAKTADTVSLAGVTSYEQMAARVLGGRDAGRAVGERFSPLVANAPTSRGPGGLDEVAWVSMSVPGERSGSSLASLPVGRALPLSTASAVAPVEPARPQTRSAGEPHSAAGEARSDMRGLTSTALISPRTNGETLSSQEPTALLRRASRARKALGRTTLTAREIQEVAPFLASLIGERQSGEHPSLMPSLVNGLTERAQQVQGLESIRQLDPTLGEQLLARISASTPALSPTLKDSLIQAGWSGPELELLQLDGRSAGRDTDRTGVRQSPASATGLMRKVARLLTGTESLSGLERFGGLDETPMGRRSNLGYFEGVAPPRLHDSSRVSLSDAIGELLALAETAGAPKDSAMSAVLGRLQGAEQLLVSSPLRTLGQETANQTLGQETANQTLVQETANQTLGQETANQMLGQETANQMLGQETANQTLVKPREASTLSRRMAAAASRVGQGPAGLDRLTQRSTPQAHDVGLDMRLGSALAPELMLPGLADPAAMRAGRGFDSTREIVHLESGAPLANRSEFEFTSGSVRSGAQTWSTQGRPGRGPGRRSTPPVGGFSAELLHGVARGREAAGPVAGRQRGLTSFGNAWLSRVDGARTGLDLGIDPEQTPFSAAFGAEPEGTRTALTDDLHLVNTAGSSEGLARSGQRSAARRDDRAGGASPRTSSRRATRNKGAALRHVDVGGRGAGPRRNLDQMASRVRGTSMGGERSSMPLIANSMQAVAQSAMRSATAERAPGDRVHEERVSSAKRLAESESDAASRDNTLSKEAFEALAQQMADRVARELKRERERRGQWT